MAELGVFPNMGLICLLTPLVVRDSVALCGVPFLCFRDMHRVSMKILVFRDMMPCRCI